MCGATEPKVHQTRYFQKACRSCSSGRPSLGCKDLPVLGCLKRRLAAGAPLELRRSRSGGAKRLERSAPELQAWLHPLALQLWRSCLECLRMKQLSCNHGQSGSHYRQFSGCQCLEVRKKKEIFTPCLLIGAATAGMAQQNALTLPSSLLAGISSLTCQWHAKETLNKKRHSGPAKIGGLWGVYVLDGRRECLLEGAMSGLSKTQLSDWRLACSNASARCHASRAFWHGEPTWIGTHADMLQMIGDDGENGQEERGKRKPRGGGGGVWVCMVEWSSMQSCTSGHSADRAAWR